MKCKSIPGWVVITLALLSTLFISGCPSPVGSPTGKLSIVVTYSILGSLVQELLADKAIVTVSIPNGQDPHEWEPSARDIEAINKADMIVQNGLGLEAGLNDTLRVAQNRGLKFFTAADNITVRYVGPGEGINSDDPDQIEGAPDPHLWMDPLAMKSVVSALSDELTRNLNLDVAQEAAELQSRLDELDQEVEGILEAVPPENRKLVTGHESMGYFAQRYGFELIGVIIPSLSSQAEVSAADLAAIKEVILENQVKAIFTEMGTAPAVAMAIGGEAGVRVVELQAAFLPADGSYFTFMRNIATTVTDALK